MSYTFDDANAECALIAAEAFQSALFNALLHAEGNLTADETRQLDALHATATARADRLRWEFFGCGAEPQIAVVEGLLAERGQQMREQNNGT